MSSRHVRRLLEEQGRAGLETLGGDDSEGESDSAEERPARPSGFADLVGSDSEDESEGSAPDSAPEDPVGRESASSCGASTKQQKHQKPSGKTKTPRTASQASGGAAISDEALAAALREAGAFQEAEALLREAQREAEGDVSAASTAPRVLELPSTIDGWLHPEADSLEPGAEFLRIFGESSVRAARDERAADQAAGRERDAAMEIDAARNRDGERGREQASTRGLTRAQRRNLERAQRRRGGRAGAAAAAGLPLRAGGRRGPEAGASHSGPSRHGRHRAAGLKLLGQDAFTRDGGLDEVPEPPVAAAGGLRMRQVAGSGFSIAGASASVSEFIFEHPPEYAELQRMYRTAVARYDIDAVFRLAGAAPHLVDANLQVCEYFRSIGKLDDAGKALRRAMYALERAWHPAFKPWDGPCRLTFEIPQNRAMHTALWRNAQLVGKGGAARTAFSLVRLLRSLDPERDPMRTALAFGKLLGG